MKTFIRATTPILFLTLLCILAGCKTTDFAKDGSLASVVISGYSEDQIRQATIDVFTANGFSQTTGLTFEKQGTQHDTLMFGGLDSVRVWIRIRVHIVDQGMGRYALGCDAYAVQNHGDALVETENRLRFSKDEECLDLLKQVRRQLTSSSPKS
jgi:hypothetical protein